MKGTRRLQGGDNAGKGRGVAVPDSPGRQSAKKDAKRIFEPYWSKDAVSDGLKRGSLIQGALRINPKNFKDAYVPHPDGFTDIYIPSVELRNRALNGDIVAVELFSTSEWKVNAEDLDSVFSRMKLDRNAEDNTVNGKPDGDGMGSEVVAADVGRVESTSDAVARTPNNQGNGEQPKSAKNGKKKTQAAKLLYKSLSDYVADANNELQLRNHFADYMAPSNNSEFRRYIQPTGKVVYIIEKKHSRACAGVIKPRSDGRTDLVMFSPNDSRLPRINIPVSECPQGFLNRPEDFSSTLFVCRITGWPETSNFADGMLAKSLGEAGEIEPETEAMLTEYGVDCEEFSAECLASLPKESPWTIPAEEINLRRDFRQTCVFTVDPTTARDLDDAVSCERLSNDEFEVGVHIADVSYFLKEGTPLDYVASQRATSVYLVQKVIPMLPRLLCEELCSLNPGVDRLAFSVVWRIDAKGKVYDQWFGRTVIRSCAKLSYNHAQAFIEEPQKVWTTDELPEIYGGFTPADLSDRVLILDKMAKKMRQRRVDNGSLRLDQVKLSFALDAATGLPNGCSVYEQRDANKLIEEFMLLANMAVARKIYNELPGKALLRRHPPPQVKMMLDLAEQCTLVGMPVDTSSAGALQKSLSQYKGDDEESCGRLQILVSMCAKPMQMARYFCTGIWKNVADYRHYALAVPLYTHFTSPIRRYADVIVHRLLAASLHLTAEPVATAGDIEQQAGHCNYKKNNAKRVQEQSQELFFAALLKSCGSLEEKGMVMAVLDRSFDVFILKHGVIGRVYCEKLPLNGFKYNLDKDLAELQLTWSGPPELEQTIKMFTLVDCVIEPDGRPCKCSFTVKQPCT